jgi:hypothetical protein
MTDFEKEPYEKYWLREERRFLQERYNSVPWASEEWSRTAITRHIGGCRRNAGPFNHYPHVSEDNPAQIAFTPDPIKGRADIQIRMKPGRYLTRYFGHILTESEIRDWASQWAAENENLTVKFARTPDEIEQVYNDGPHSCMSGNNSFESDISPVRVYGAGDLAIAYLERDGDITARVVCWPENECYSTIYGDAGRLRPLLDGMGYSETDTMSGARLLRVEQSGCFVAPYLDTDGYLRDLGNHLVISDCGGDISADSTTGLAGPPRQYCPRCEEFAPEEDFEYVDNAGEYWCAYCVENETTSCDDCHRTVVSEDTHEVENNNHVCNRCIDNYSLCEDCDTMSSEVEDINDRAICADCASEYPTCPQCDEKTEDGYCADCTDEPTPTPRCAHTLPLPLPPVYPEGAYSPLPGGRALSLYERLSGIYYIVTISGDYNHHE